MLESIYRPIPHESELEASGNDTESDDRNLEPTVATISGMAPRFSATSMSNCRTDSVYGMLCAREMGTPHSVSMKAA